MSFFAAPLYAQNGWGSGASNYVENFAKKSIAIKNREDVEALSTYLTRDVSVSYTLIALNGQKRVVHGDWREFLRNMETLLTDSSTEKKYEMRGVKYDAEVGNYTIATYQLDYVQYRGGQAQTKGMETVTVTCRKVDDTWLITDFNSIGIELERYRGSCLCEIFISEEDKFTTKTIAPNGKSYQSHLLEFVFSVCDHRNQIYAITAGKNFYKWLINGEVYLMASPEDCTIQPTTALGLAANKIEAIRIIIEKHLLLANCTTVSVKK